MVRTASVILLVTSAMTLAAEDAVPVLPAFDVADFETAGGNAYYPLTIGVTRHSATAPGADGESAEANGVTVLGRGLKSLGSPPQPCWTRPLRTGFWSSGLLTMSPPMPTATSGTSARTRPTSAMA